MNILITVLELDSYSGLPLYTRDLALELKRQGHRVEIYTLHKGVIADSLESAGIPVCDNPAQIKIRPDIIHGQHRVAALIAIKQFRRTPAIFVCHNHTFWGDQAPIHPRILLYLGVSHVCMQRLRSDGIPEDWIVFSPNSVDTNRFKPRGPLPPKPRKALVFSNYAYENTHLPAVREACLRAGLELDVAGMSMNYTSSPETILGNYDIIFAKARAAIESVAVGAAVILCDYSGVGPMVSVGDFERLRRMNFGFESLDKTLDAQNILPEIARYDPVDAANTRDLMRATASLEKATREMVSLYETVVEKNRKSGRKLGAFHPSLPLSESFYWERARFWATLRPFSNDFLGKIAALDPAAYEHTYIFARKGGSL